MRQQLPNLYEYADIDAYYDAIANESVVLGGKRYPAPYYLEQQWAHLARPGQRWTYGAEQVTLWSLGRGCGKTRGAAECIYEGAMDPERWGGYALIIGPEPRHIEDNCLNGLSGILTLAARRPWFQPVHYPSKRLLVFPNPRGGGSGLEVRYASSEKPRQVRGPNVGFIWVDEFAHCNFRETAGGQNFWETAQDALRARGADEPRALLTTTPLPTPEVIELWREALNPKCPACGAHDHPKSATLAEMARSAMTLVDPRFTLRTTDPEQVCLACGHEFAARVRVVNGSTMDNEANLADDYVERRVKPRMGTRLGKQEVGGLVLEDTPGALIPFSTVHYVAAPAEVGDGWIRRLAEMWDLTELVTFVDPAMVGSDGADESGVVTLAKQGATGLLFALLDDSVAPSDVTGSPSSLWGPRAYASALDAGCQHISAETNQGGDLVLEVIPRAALEVEGERLYRKHHPEAPKAWHTLAAHIRTSWGERALSEPAARPKTKRIHNFRSKQARFEWAAEYFERQQVRLVVPRGRDRSYWQDCVASLTGYSPRVSKTRTPKRDRGDAFIGAMRDLLGVDEATRYDPVPLSSVSLAEAWRV